MQMNGILLLRRLGVLLLVAALGACTTFGSTLDSLNPFAKSAPKVKPKELVAIQPSVDLKSSWQTGVGAGGEYILSPAVVGSSVYVAGKDGSLIRLDGGKQVWKINVGQTISGAVGASEMLVVVLPSAGLAEVTTMTLGGSSTFDRFSPTSRLR